MIKTTTSYYRGILSTGGSGDYFEIIFCSNGQLYLQWIVNGASYTTGCVGIYLNDNNWHTVLVTYDGITLTFYEDGISQYTTTPITQINDGKVLSFFSFMD
jgi:hypothetical protein